jgi:hypothetical protein
MLRVSLYIAALALLAAAGCGSDAPEVSDQFDYEGELKGNLAHGYGAIYEDGQLVYEGTFEDGLISGSGRFYENGVLRYEGEIRQTLILGRGTIYREGRTLFDGEILENRNDVLTVDGILFDADEQPFYSGELVIDGTAIRFPPTGKLLYPSGEVYYEGELADGLPAGAGTYYDVSGAILFDRR